MPSPTFRLFRLLVFYPLVCLLAFSSIAATAPLRISAWNLEHLGSRTDPERTDEDLEALVIKIRSLGVSILAVSEINGWRTLRDLTRRLGPEWDGVLGRSGFIGGNPPKQIGVGFLWDKSRVKLIHAEEWVDMPRRLEGLPVFHRLPVSASFRSVGGGPDFRLVAVHLKAGFNATDIKKRFLELGEIKNRIDALISRRREDLDIAVLGDFNHGARSPENTVFSGNGYSTYLVPKTHTSTIIHFNEQIDHIVPLSSFNEIKPQTFQVIKGDGKYSKKTWRNRYSDHYPVIVELHSGPDDDPHARFSKTGKQLRPLSQFRE